MALVLLHCWRVQFSKNERVMRRVAVGSEATSGKRRGLLKGISRNTFVLGLVSFLNDLSSDMIHPHLLALFLKEVLRASTAQIGVIGGLTESMASMLKPVSGWLSDKLRKRKPGILLGYWLAACTRPLLAVSGTIWHVLILRFADRVGKGARAAPRDALIADSTDPAYRGKAFGFHRSLDNLGAAFGMLAAMVLLLVLSSNLETTLRTVIWIAALPGILAMSLVIWGVRESKDPPPAESPEGGGLRVRDVLTPELAKWYLVVFVFWLGNSSNMFLILKARGMEMAVWKMPLLMFVMSIVRVVFSTPAGALSDRLGRRGIIVSGWALYALVYAGFAFANCGWMMFALFAFYGLYYALTEGAERALVTDLAPVQARATVLGLYHFVVGSAALPASIICGLLWQWKSLGVHGPRIALGFGAACALLASVLFLVLNPRPSAPEEKS